MLKIIFLSIFLTIYIDVSAQQIEWMTMNEALEQQKDDPKKIILFVYTEWCKNCHEMNETTFVHKDVVKYVNDNFYAANFNGEGTEIINYKGFEYTNPNYDPDREGRNYQHFFADALKITAYPSIVFFDETGEVISPVRGYKSAEDIEIYLKMVASDDYKSVTSAEAWQAYQKAFTPKFKVN